MPLPETDVDVISASGEEKTAHVLPDVIPPALRAETRAGKKRFGFVSGLLWSLAVCALLTPLIDFLLPARRFEWSRPTSTPKFQLKLASS